MLGEESNVFKAQYLYGKHGRKCGRHKCEGECALPGGDLLVCLVLGLPRGGPMDQQKSAEGILGRSIRLKARTCNMEQEP